MAPVRTSWSFDSSSSFNERLAQEEESRDAVLDANDCEGEDSVTVRLKRLRSNIGSLEHEVLFNLGIKSFDFDKAAENDVIRGFFCTYVRGFEGRTKLKDYNLQRVVVLGGIASMFCHGTVFLMDRTVRVMCVQQFLIVVAFAMLGHYVVTFDEEDIQSFERLVKQTSRLVPLILGLFISNSLARWWALREKSIGSIFDALIDLSMLMVAQRPEPKWKPLHVQLTKFGLASIQLILKAARDNNDMTDLLTDGLLTQDEAEYLEELQSFHRPVAVWSWILRLCQFAWIGLPPPTFNPIQVCCTQAKSSIDNIYTYQRTQMPFAYTHLVACLAHAQNVFAAIHAGLSISLDMGSAEAWVREIAMALIVCLIYQGLLALSYVIEDPFGDDLLDFPIKSYTAYVMATVQAVQEAQWHSPALHKLKARLQAGGS